MWIKIKQTFYNLATTKRVHFDGANIFIDDLQIKGLALTEVEEIFQQLEKILVKQ